MGEQGNVARVPIQVGHSADPDDAFMVWALEAGKVDTRGLELEPVASDIQTLNEWALEGRLEVTALSAGAYPAVADRYVLLPHGASFGEGYGPIVVARERARRSTSCARSRSSRRARSTTASRVLRLALGDGSATRDLPFDAVLDEVVSGRADAGPADPRGPAHLRRRRPAQAARPRRLVAGDETGLPLPLGVVAIRRDVDAARRRLGRPARSDRRRAREPRRGDRATRMGFGRGIDAETADEFVAMYVNDLTLDMGERGRAARSRCLLGARAGVRRVSARGRDPLRRAHAGRPVRRRRSPACARTISRRSPFAPRSTARACPRSEIEDVWLGCANQAGEDNRNVARMAVLLAGLPESVGGVTVNRLCASGLAGDRRRLPRGGRRRRRPLRRRRRRVDVARAARHREARDARSRAATARSTTRRSAGASRTRGSRSGSRSRRWARPARTSPSAGTSRARTRTRSRSRSQQRWAAAAEAGRFDDELVPVGDARRATSIRAPTRRPRSSRR